MKESTETENNSVSVFSNNANHVIGIIHNFEFQSDRPSFFYMQPNQ